MSKKSSQPAIISKEVEIILNEGKKSRIPRNIEPMLATLVAETPAGENWIYEMKWDGYRAISYLYNSSVDICSRNNKSFNKKFYPIYDALQTWKMDVVLDGEIVVLRVRQVIVDIVARRVGDGQIFRVIEGGIFRSARSIRG